ncbi:MAG: DUF445 family protein [Pseudomonadota bacterium]
MLELGPEEQRKLSALSRVKLFATLVLVACFVVMVITKLLEAHYPWLAIVVAFAEAATIGGVADWYAVVALFRKPLNLPIPHTAIIPNNQHRIGENLGRFIEKNFLAPGPVEERLRRVDFSGEIATWLSDHKKAEILAEFMVKLLPQLLSAIDERGFVKFAMGRVTTQLEKTDIAPLVGEIMDSLADTKRNQKLINDLISALHRFLNDEEALNSIRKKVNAELPTLLNLFRADALILNRIVKAAGSLLDDIKNDPEHELREELEHFLKKYVRSLRRSKRFKTRVEQMKRQILARPEVASIAEQTWASVRKLIEEDIQSGDSVLIDRMADMFVDIGKTLEDEPRLRGEINDGMVTIISNFVANQKGAISQFVADQVKGWDFRQLTVLIEANIGKDLQYIRFNGMIIGGFVGVLLFLIESWLL